jgi:hypothetical protein
MYGLAEDFDGSFFVGRLLRTVAFSRRTLDLIFDENVSIGLESSYECRLVGDEGYVEKERLEAPIASSRLMQLLGRKVLSVDTEREGTLTLHFEGGHVFRCFDDDPNYESYTISHGNDEIYV